MTPAEKLLPLLDHVNERGNAKWTGRCPSHDDGRPSLSIQETSDGTLLIHCFAACTPAEVLDAVGLTLADLFPNKLESNGKHRPRWSVKDLLIALSMEFTIVLVAVNDIASGKTLNHEDLERVAQAGARVQRIKEICRVG